MSSSLASVRLKLFSVIKRFHFEELESAVIPSFPELTWNAVRAKIIKNHESFTVSNVVRVIEQVIDDAGLNANELQDRLHTLEVIDVSRHSKRKIWYGYKLRPTNERPALMTNRELKDRIIASFMENQIRVVSRVVSHDGIIFASIVEKPRRATRHNQNILPTFFALFQRQNYFFGSKKNISQKYLHALTSSLNFNEFRELKLVGRDLKSLIKLLHEKKQGAVHADLVDTPVTYTEPEPVVRSTGIDFTQHKHRRGYVEKCFGENPATVEMIAINCPKCSSKELPRKLKRENIATKWEFRSTHVANFLKNLAERRVLTTPLPPYVANLMTGGKTVLTLRQ